MGALPLPPFKGAISNVPSLEKPTPIKTRLVPSLGEGSTFTDPRGVPTTEVIASYDYKGFSL